MWWCSFGRARFPWQATSTRLRGAERAARLESGISGRGCPDVTVVRTPA